MECSRPNSQRSARCHLSEMDLTRQRLVTFLREEMCAAVLQGSGSAGPRSGKTVEVLSAGAALNACRSNRRSAESSVWAIRTFVAKRRVMGGEFGKHLTVCDSRPQRLDAPPGSISSTTSLRLRLCREHGRQGNHRGCSQ